MLRKSVSVFLVAVMTAGLLAGCGSPGNNMAGQDTEKIGADEPSADADQALAEDAPGSSDLSGQEPYTVRIVADGFGSDEACAEISAAVSEITRAKFNTDVELVRYDFATYVDKVQTELASGEKIDLLGGVSDISIPSAASQGQVLALKDRKSTRLNSSH